MQNSPKHVIRNWSALGFGAGVLLTGADFLVFYILPDGSVSTAAQAAFQVATWPATKLAVLLSTSLTIPGFFVVRILAELLQWTLLGFIFGCWRLCIARKKGAEDSQLIGAVNSRPVGRS